MLVLPSAFMIDVLSHKTLSHCPILPDNLIAPPTYDPFLGQERFSNALKLACHLKDTHHHVFVVSDQDGHSDLVPPIRQLLSSFDKTTPRTLNDCIYVHNFADPKRPKALLLPAGHAKAFANQVHAAYHRCKKKLAFGFETLTYQARRQQLKLTLKKSQARAVGDFNQHAYTYNAKFDPDLIIGLDELQAVDDQKPIDPKVYQDLHRPLQKLIKTLDALTDEYENATDQLEQSQAKRVVDGVFAKLLANQTDPKLIAYLRSYSQALITHLCCCDDDWSSDPPAHFFINVLSEHSTNTPIIYATYPMLTNMTGCVQSDTNEQKRADVSTIKAGLLHLANGGFLIVRASDLLDLPDTWQTLKHALLSKTIQLRDGHLSDQHPSTLSPDPIALDIKVILIGDSDAYDEMMDDNDARCLFGVRADWAWQIANTQQNQLSVLGHIHHLITSHHLLPFSQGACAMLLQALSRHVAHKHYLSLDNHHLSQLTHQSHAIAKMMNATQVQVHHVSAAIDAQKDRHGGLWRFYWRELTEGKHLITTQGNTIGQVNALSVIDDGFYAFGLPVRLTARVACHPNKTRIHDVERSVHLGGNIHAKAVLIMSGFLQATFSEHCPLNVSAFLVFEQNYGHIDGDSATLAQACALLSALADVPTQQGLAITGSMNQLGQVQAVGGINAKIEGFFDLCQHQGITGNQGVIIPKTCVSELVLADRVVTAVENGQFSIYAIDDVFDAAALLMGIPINDRTQEGNYKKNTLFAKIIARLEQWQAKPNT